MTPSSANSRITPMPSSPDAEARRALALRELLLQEAYRLRVAVPADAAPDNRDDALIEALLEKELTTPEPNDAECRRYYDSHPGQFRSGDLVEASHILLAVTPRTPLAPLRA